MISGALTIRAGTSSLVAAGACPLVALAFAFNLATLALTDTLAVSMFSRASAVSVLAVSLVAHVAVDALRCAKAKAIQLYQKKE
jgi:hypothetical protein